MAQKTSLEDKFDKNISLCGQLKIIPCSNFQPIVASID